MTTMLGETRPNRFRTPAARGGWLLLAGVAVMALALGLGILSAQPPLPKPVDAPAAEFSAGRAMAIAGRLLGDGAPHPVGTDANARVAERIQEDLAALGYTVETQVAWACSSLAPHCAEVTNLLTRLPGESDGPAVLLTAHYDSVPAGPGAADDMAGVATMLEIARILQDDPPLAAPVIFLFSDGEEPGLLGAEAFTRHPRAADVGVVINLEANGTRGQSLLFETTEENAWLVDAYATEAPRPVASSLYEALYDLTQHDTDLSVYEDAGLPGINFAITEQGAFYHTPLDNLANLDPGSVQHHGENALAATRAFAARDLQQPVHGNVVFIDLLPGVLLHWPEPLTIWLTLGGVVVWAVTAALLLRRGALAWRGLLWGGLATLVGMVVAILLGLALTFAVTQGSGAPVPWYAHPLPLRVALWAAALLGMVAPAALLARRAGFWGSALGAWFWWVTLSLAAAWFAPEISPILLLPTLLGVGALALASGPWFAGWPWTRVVAVLIGLFGASWFWLPLALVAEEMGLGVELGAVVAGAVALAASAFTPLLAIAPLSARQLALGAAGGAVVMIVAAVVGTTVPAYSADQPQRLNVLHIEDRSVGEAYWALQGEFAAADSGDAVPPQLMAMADFDDTLISFLPWSDERLAVSWAPATDAPAPSLEILNDEMVGGTRTVTLRLGSERGGDRISLYVPERGDIQRIDVQGVERPLERFPIEKGYQAFHCFGVACDGLVLTLSLAGDSALSLLVVDSTPGLPPEGDALLSARPEAAQPSQGGDRSLLIDWIALPAA